MILQVHGLICFLSSCKQQATKTEPQAVAKLEVNLGQSANSLWTVTQKKDMFQTNNKSYPKYFQIQAK